MHWYFLKNIFKLDALLYRQDCFHENHQIWEEIHPYGHQSSHLSLHPCCKVRTMHFANIYSVMAEKQKYYFFVLD